MAFHERTKIYRHHDRTMGRRIGDYLSQPRAVRETAANHKVYDQAPRIPLPEANLPSTPFRDVVGSRHSTRAFNGAGLSLHALSNILSAISCTRTARSTVVPEANLHFRRYPSGGGLNPTEVYLMLNNVDAIDPCVVHYDPRSHALEVLSPLFAQAAISDAVGADIDLIASTSCIVLVTAIPERSVVKYASRGYRFALLEAGMVPFLLDLCATMHGLGTLHWGGFFDDSVNSLLSIDSSSETVVSCLLIGGRS